MAIPVTNCWDPDAPLDRLPMETAWLFRPETEWTYAHHPHVVRFKDRWNAFWSNGRVDEDAPGQRVLGAVSDDGLTWSDPRPVLDVRTGMESELVLTAAGFHAHEGTLVAYVGRYEYLPERLNPDGSRKKGDTGHRDPGLDALVSEDGETWSEPRDLGVPLVPNHGPQPTASGRLVIAGNIMFPWTDDPAGLSGWTPAGIYPPEMQDEVMDDSHKFWLIKEKMGWPVGLCEGSFYQTDDGVLHMLLRSGTDRLWITESVDDARSWSPPEPTDFTDNATKFHFGRLPDGRFYYVGSPDPRTRGARARLVLSLSEDGVRFDRHFLLGDDVYEKRRDGMHKGGQYGYPHTCVADGRLMVIVSRMKEAIQILSVDLDALP